jgi:predicted nucleic acid-binding Zn ribbon protein
VKIHRSRPVRPAAQGVRALVDRMEPDTLLARVQRAWPAVVGEAIAAQATPTAARAGTVTISCRAAVWAQELDLMGPELVERLNAAVGDGLVAAIRCQSTPTRGWSKAAR